jgi:Nucleotide modification associated domain 1
VGTTLEQFDAVVAKCKEIYLKKTTDYGTAWRILRPSSLTDQLYIKAKRIRTIEMQGNQQVADSVDTEYQGIVNYSVMALIQLEKSEDQENLELSVPVATHLFDQHIAVVRALLSKKNHDYGEAWRDMRLSSFTDMILMKLMRIKQIEDNQGKTLISEGLDANYMDILNYAVFALIKLDEQKTAS